LRKKDTLEKSLKPLRTTQALFFLNAALMLAVGVLTLVRPPQSSLGLTIFTAVLLFIDAALLAGCAIIIARRQKLLNLIAAVVLAANILLTVLDEVGLPDLIVLVLFLSNLILLFLTIKQDRFPVISQT
jgi:hypothetical protein